VIDHSILVYIVGLHNIEYISSLHRINDFREGQNGHCSALSTDNESMLQGR
jgi:hypothetical protein